jgi:hypothetical protein
MIPELPEINSGFASCYLKSPNEIRVLGILGLNSVILGSGFGLWVFCPTLTAQVDSGLINVEHMVSFAKVDDRRGMAFVDY